MKMKNLCYLILLIFCMIGVSSCESDENSISPSETSVTMEGEGGEFEIQLNSDNWRIAEVINKNGDVRIFGETFTLDGKKVRENSLLELEGLGSLEAFWYDKGFSITRDYPEKLKISLKPNATGKDFSFSILLQNEKDTREIIIEQKVCQGYGFDNIEYFLDEGDGDSLFWQKAVTFKFSYTTPSTISFGVFGGVDIMNKSYFESNDPYAFIWVAKDSIAVAVPERYYDGELFLSGEKRVYGAITKILPTANDRMINLEVPAGKIQFEKHLEWRTRKVSYRLTLKNLRTDEKMSVVGKWIETTPTGNYKMEEVPYDDNAVI